MKRKMRLIGKEEVLDFGMLRFSNIPNSERKNPEGIDLEIEIPRSELSNWIMGAIYTLNVTLYEDDE